MRPASAGGTATITCLAWTLAFVEYDLDALGVLDDLAHGRVQDDAAAEFRRDLQRDLLAAADEAFFLRAFGGLEVAFEGPGMGFVAGRGEVEQHVEQRQVARLLPEDRLDRGAGEPHGIRG